MLRINIPENFIPERKYIIDTLLGDFLGLDYDIRTDTYARDWEIILENGNRLIIEDHFFNHIKPADNYYQTDYLPQNVKFITSRFSSEANIPVIFGGEWPSVRRLAVNDFDSTERSTICSADIFASSFFMLTRWEEYAIQARDQHGRFPARESLAVKFDFIDRPVVNEYTEMLWNMLVDLKIEQSRKRRRFDFNLTHDVDTVALWNNFLGLCKSLAGDILKRKSIFLALSNLKCFLKYKFTKGKQPYNTFDYLMDKSDKYGLKSNFFLMSGGRTKYDNYYNINDRATIKLIANIENRGHKIGFHPSYDSINNKDQWQSELDALTKITSSPPKQGRQHYLRFDNPNTWGIWEENLMRYDSTLGYAEREGFRCGTCYDFSVFDILSRKQLRLREKPLIAMDITLVQYRRFNPGQVLNKLKQLVDIVYRYDGTFTLLWHNSSFNLYPWDKYKSAYEDILEYASQALDHDQSALPGITPVGEKHRKAVLLTYHCRHSKRQAGFHQIANALNRRGWETLFFTAPYSPLSKIRNDYRTKYIKPEEVNRINRVSDRCLSFVWKTPWHPVNLRSKILNKLFSPIFRLYDKFYLGQAEEYCKTADLFIFESTVSLMLFDRIRRLNPTAKIIYRVSDDLRLLKSHELLIEAEARTARQFDLISTPSEYIYDRFESLDNSSLSNHGIRKDLYDTEFDNPYDTIKTNLVFLGQAHLDYDFIARASEEYPDWQFHMIGPMEQRIVRDNIIYYGEMPFAETIKYVKFADIGLHTLCHIPGAESFTDSLKVIQYTYCQLPIIAPNYLRCERENMMYYTPGDNASIVRALNKALVFDRSRIGNRNIQSWDELVGSWLSESKVRTAAGVKKD